jgi:hypothetical protein
MMDYDEPIDRITIVFEEKVGKVPNISNVDVLLCKEYATTGMSKSLM